MTTINPMTYITNVMKSYKWDCIETAIDSSGGIATIIGIGTKRGTLYLFTMDLNIIKNATIVNTVGNIEITPISDFFWAAHTEKELAKYCWRFHELNDMVTKIRNIVYVKHHDYNIRFDENKLVKIGSDAWKNMTSLKEIVK